MEDLTKEKWKQQIASDEKAILIDVRTPGEWEEGIQKGAMLINLFDGANFMQTIEKLNKENNYYLYCRSRGRSASACEIMESKGFKTFNLIGGMMQWDGEIVNK